VIRVNLLPHKQKKDRLAAPQSSQKWLLVVLGVLVFEIVGLFIFHQTKVDDLDEQKKTNTRLQGEIKDIRQLVSNHEEIKKQLAELRAREDAIAKLQAGRSGPTAVLLEVAQLMTPGKGPTVTADQLKQYQQNNPLGVYNPAWDARRLWLTKYVESQRVVRIEGKARDSADVSEFAIRLSNSPYFYDMRLLPGKKAKSKDDVELVEFAIELKVRY
jgi:type IV pilus assembly protein PilN